MWDSQAHVLQQHIIEHHGQLELEEGGGREGCTVLIKTT